MKYRFILCSVFGAVSCAWPAHTVLRTSGRLGWDRRVGGVATGMGERWLVNVLMRDVLFVIPQKRGGPRGGLRSGLRRDA